MLESAHSPFVIKLIESGCGAVIRKGIIYQNKNYIIMEYAEEGNLLDYVYP